MTEYVPVPDQEGISGTPDNPICCICLEPIDEIAKAGRITTGMDGLAMVAHMTCLEKKADEIVAHSKPYPDYRDIQYQPPTTRARPLHRLDERKIPARTDKEKDALIRKEAAKLLQELARDYLAKH